MNNIKNSVQIYIMDKEQEKIIKKKKKELNIIWTKSNEYICICQY